MGQGISEDRGTSHRNESDLVYKLWRRGRRNGWTWQFDNAGQVEDALSKLMADREYLTAITKAESLIVPGSIQDQMWRQV